MTKKEIDKAICDILIEDGPDGHIDGHEEITAFIIQLLESQKKVWYRKLHNKLFLILEGKKQLDNYFNEIGTKLD